MTWKFHESSFHESSTTLFHWIIKTMIWKLFQLYNRLIEEQRFVQERLIALGPDLSAAYFLIARFVDTGYSVHFTL